MTNHIKQLFELCKKQPFNTEEIRNYIAENKLSVEEVTRASIKLADYGFCSRGDYIYQHEKEPQPEELITYNWEALFDVLIENGLDANMIFIDDGGNYDNIMQSLQFLDDGYLGAKIVRNLLSNNGNPNIIIDDTPFFKDIDDNFIFDIQLGCYHHKWQQDIAFRFWLVLAAFGGVIRDGLPPIEMCGDFKIDIFKEFEKFDYNIKWGEKDFDLEIFDKKTGTIVGIA